MIWTHLFEVSTGNLAATYDQARGLATVMTENSISMADPVPEAACAWTEDSDGAWDTGCGYRFEFTDGDPADNNFVHCPYCGATVEARHYVRTFG